VLEARVGDVEELLGRGEGGRGAARGDRGAIRAEQTVSRDPEYPALEIPQCEVADAEQPDRELLRAVELPQPVPEPLPPVRPLANELFAKHAVDDVGKHRPAPLVIRLPDLAPIGRDAQNRRGALPGRPAQT